LITLLKRGYKVQLLILTRIMKVMCQLSASTSRISYMATTLASSSSKYPNCLALEPAVLSSLSPFLKPLLTSSTCILIPQASSSCLELLSNLLLGGSCEGPGHLLREVQEFLKALGCQETVQTMLEKDAHTKSEVVSGQPTCEIDLEVSEETATDCLMGDDGNLQNQKETLLEEKPEEGHDHEDEDSQEMVTTKNKVLPEIFEDENSSAGNTLVKCEPQQAYLQVNDPVSGERGIKLANVLSHMNNAIKDDLPRFPCDKCPYRATQPGHLRRHQNAKHNGIRHKCDHCDSTFSIKHTLTRHVESRHKGILFPCPQCKFEATRMSHLRDHIQNKHLKLKYECDVCGHMLSSKGTLKIHRRTEHEGIWWRCKEQNCDYEAKDSSSLNYHKKVVHDGERLACPKCNKYFTKITSLRSHLSKKHKAGMEGTT